MKTTITLIILITLPAISLGLTSCVATPRVIEGAERDAVLAYAEPKTDNELAALNSNDYQAFIRDYDETMLKVTTPENFATLYNLISTKLGKYLSREVTSIAAIGEDAVIIVYSASFEHEQGVTIRVVFQPGGDHLIIGLWFDSPKLREK